ncbi:MAG TPA: hypothetical protein VIP70_01360 [Nitrososphaeraceae archaeon]
MMSAPTFIVVVNTRYMICNLYFYDRKGFTAAIKIRRSDSSILRYVINQLFLNMLNKGRSVVVVV